MTRLVDSIKPDVIAKLEIGPKTLRQISRAIGQNYYTTRMAVVGLMEDGIVTKSGIYNRNVPYMLTRDSAPNNSIPIIQHQKMFNILGMRHTTTFNASQAVFNFPMHIARLFMIALRLKNSQAQGDALQRLQAAMQQDLAHIKHAEKLYEAVIKNPNNWTESMLIQYTNDAVFNEAEVNEAYAHYFRTE